MQIYLDTEKQTLTIDGVTMSLSLLLALAHPDNEFLYRIHRIGNQSFLTQIPNVEMRECSDTVH